MQNFSVFLTGKFSAWIIGRCSYKDVVTVVTMTASIGLKDWFSFQPIDFGFSSSIFSTGVKVTDGFVIKLLWCYKSHKSDIPEWAHPFSVWRATSMQSFLSTAKCNPPVGEHVSAMEMLSLSSCILDISISFPTGFSVFPSQILSYCQTVIWRTVLFYIVLGKYLSHNWRREILSKWC